MKFRISSGLKNHIGRELITDDNVAIFELVKNSYDADAKNVKIVFKDMRSQDKKIIIIDDGIGMSKEDLENKWLFVAYSEKKDLAKNIKNKRLMAGSKGLGRFSCDRLGSKLKIYTKVRTDKDFNLLSVDWGKFEKDQKKEFKEVEVDLKTNQKPIENYETIGYSGTIIEISDLRDDWDWKKMQKLKGYLQRLINPLQIPGGDSFDIELIAEEFVVNDHKQKFSYNKVNGKIQNIVYEKLEVKTTTIECNISENGKKIFTKLNDKGINIFELEEENKFDFKDMKVKVSFLNQQAKTTFTRIMGIEAVNYGNLFVFKNGFRVFPYGEEDNDWLQINKRKAQGYNRFLGTREVLGRIEINDFKSEFFKEVTSRSEGFMSNVYFNQLKEFVLEFAIKRLEKYVVGAIDWDSDRDKHPTKKKKDFEDIKKDTLKIIKQIAGGSLKNVELKYNKDFLAIAEKKNIEKIPEIIKNIKHLIGKEKDVEIKDRLNKQIFSLTQSYKLKDIEQKKELEEKEQELEVKEKESLFLSGALSVDQEATQRLIHIINNSMDPIHKALFEINKHIQKDSPIKKIIPFVDDVSLEHSQIKYLSEILSMANFNTKVEKIKKDIVQYIFQYLKNMKYSNLKFYFKNEDLKFICWFKPLEILIILNNLISNSLKQDATMMRLYFQKDKNLLKLMISDNSNKGGIKNEDTPYIFNRGHSTTKGSGRGLYDVKRILKNLRGEIKFVGNNIENQLNGACFEIKIKK